MSQRFSKNIRLRKRKEFLAVQAQGRKIHGSYFVVLALPRGETDLDAPGRLGITVSRKVGVAVTRNRIRRLVREFVRTHADWLPVNLDVVVVAKRSASVFVDRARGHEVATELLGLGPRLAAC